MDEYPRRIYLAASWRGLADTLTRRVAQSLAQRGFTLLGDHPVHREQETGRNLHWQQRVDDIMMDCGGFVGVLPPDETPQTTSPYILPEIMIAARQGLPIFLVHPPGVSVELDTSSERRLLWLPARKRRSSSVEPVSASSFPLLESSAATILANDVTYSDNELRKIKIIDLSGCPVVIGPTKYHDSRQDHMLESAIGTFVDTLRDRPSKYVFHIVPFARASLHKRVAVTVFEETGLPCVIASDNWRSPEPARQHWRQLLGGAEMVVADLSESNRNCLFEAGAAAGMNRPLQLVRGGSARKKVDIPFGLDDHLQARYESEDELAEIVRKFCVPYKRTVFNITKLSRGTSQIPGVPNWYGTEVRSSLGARTVRLQAILCIVAVVLLSATAVLWLLPQYFSMFAALIGGPIVALTLIARFLESVKSDLNDWFVARAKQIRNFSIALAIVIIVAATAARVMLPDEALKTETTQQGDAVDQPPAGN